MHVINEGFYPDVRMVVEAEPKKKSHFFMLRIFGSNFFIRDISTEFTISLNQSFLL